MFALTQLNIPIIVILVILVVVVVVVVVIIIIIMISSIQRLIHITILLTLQIIPTHIILIIDIIIIMMMIILIISGEVKSVPGSTARRTHFKPENVYVYMCGPPVLRVVVWMDGMANPCRESRGRTGVQVKARQVNA